ncbi:secretory phospholipase A2 receptor-like [Silurus meridionalis]|uniref:secretory phospholipase A2 receptor-like n=1 Tax=Silurus meridionalis TaxID=175797 RepID=UPI001EECD7AB|nr:secretory phospholipase A2 receptor-like [Silurus meridionalis]
MSSSVSLFLLLVLSEMTAGLLRQYIYNSQYMNWSDAQKYCRRTYKDLASITSEDEFQRAVQSGPSWIGLKRNESIPETWQWSGGEPANFFKWEQARYKRDDLYQASSDCVKMDTYGWTSDDCSDPAPSVCYRIVIFININMTWKDAHNYCRMHYTDLFYPFSVANPSAIESEGAKSSTDSIWTGLRFLNRKWFFLNVEKLEPPKSLSSCPTQNYYCGARNIKTHVWENRRCNDKLSFICYW